MTEKHDPCKKANETVIIERKLRNGQKTEERVPRWLAEQIFGVIPEEAQTASAWL